MFGSGGFHRRRPLSAAALAVLGMALSAAAPAASVTSSVVPAQAAASSSCAPPPVFPVADLRPGMNATGYTVLKGRTVSSFRVNILGVQPDGIAPGIDFILVKVPIGIAAGFSGSPVYLNGKLVGAVSYGLDSTDSTIGGLTPAAAMEAVLGYPRAGAAAAARPLLHAPRTVTLAPSMRRAAATAGAAAAPVAAQHLVTPVAVSGLNDRAMTRLDGILQRQHLPVALYRAGSAGATTTSRSSQPLTKGSSFAAAVSYGDITLAGIGTTTLTCGDEAMAFGHPFLFEGSQHMGMSAADVLTVVPSTFGAYKVANVAELHGTVDQDRLAGIRGIHGLMPSLVPVTSTVDNLDLNRLRNGRSDVVRQDYLPLVSSFHLISNTDVTFDRVGSGSAALTFTVQGTRASGEPFTLTRTNAWYSPDDISVASSTELPSFVNAIVTNPFEPVTVTSVHAASTVTQANLTDEITGLLSASPLQPVLLPRRTLMALPGQTVRLRVLLRPAGSTQQRFVDMHFVMRSPSGGMLTIRGGNANPGCAFCVGSDPTIPPAKSFGDLLTKLSALERNSDLVAAFESFQTGAVTKTISHQPRVILGTRLLRIIAV
jgi:hypothetical protein